MTHRVSFYIVRKYMGVDGGDFSEWQQNIFSKNGYLLAGYDTLKNTLQKF